MVTITRKCAKCKQEIEIEKNDITDVIYYEKKYYHESCFTEMATQKAASKRGKPEQWQEALDNLWQLEADTKKMIQKYFAREELNEYLLSNYDICMVPAYFWQLVADLENGKYKSKKCKPIEINVLLDIWKWGQKNLNQIALNNRANRKGPQNDDDRLRYDLAILIGHVGDFKKYKAREESQRNEIINSIKKQPKIDYSSLNRRVQDKSKSDIDTADMSELIGQIF